MMILYRFLLYCLTPFLILFTYWRVWKGKEDPERFKERFGKASLKRPQGPLYWFHGASNGECLSFLSLLQSYSQEVPCAHFLVTSQTRTSAALVHSKFPKNVLHQFLPLDHPFFVKRFLSHWDPTYIFWTESELWPCLIDEASSRASLLLLNARMSESAFFWWRKVPSLAKSILHKFKIIFCQSEKDFERFKAFGHTRVQYVGNLKFANPPLEANPQALLSLQTLSARPLWAAASTHSGEEEMVAETHKILKHSHPQILTLLVPRHPHRAGEIRTMLESQGLKVAQRSRRETPELSTDIFLFDSTGELGLVYRLCSITLVGGSLVNGVGGHNPLEASLLKCAIIVGPYTQNNQEIFDLLGENKGYKVAHTANDLAKTIEYLLSHSEEKKSLIEASYASAMEQQKVLTAIQKIIHSMDDWS